MKHYENTVDIYGWDVKDLWKAAKKLPVYEIPIIGMDLDQGLWDLWFRSTVLSRRKSLVTSYSWN